MLEGWMDEWMCKHVKPEKCMLGFLVFFFFWGGSISAGKY